MPYCSEPRSLVKKGVLKNEASGAAVRPQTVQIVPCATCLETAAMVCGRREETAGPGTFPLTVVVLTVVLEVSSSPFVVSLIKVPSSFPRSSNCDTIERAETPTDTRL